MDVKVNGVPLKILSKAFAQAAKARAEILDKIEETIPAPRAELAPSAPRIITIRIKPEQIGSVIGSGGKVVKQIKEDTGAEVDIQDDGLVYITGKNGTAEKARDIIEELTHKYKSGERFEGTVTRILDFGAFVKIGTNTDTEGLVHVSEIASFRVDEVKKYLKEGDRVPVVIKEIDEKGRINLSIKRADPDFIKEKKKE
jgi:polyribonucleotide nucleotidyltransferase